MTKKTLLAFAFMLAMAGTKALALEKIDFSISIFDPTTTEPGHGKAPIRKPSVWQEDYQIEFQGSHAEYVLNIVDGDEVVYTTVVSSCETVIYLPSWLSGEYEIQLVQGRFMFVGNIEL